MYNGQFDDITTRLLYSTQADAISVLELSHSPAVSLGRVMATTATITAKLTEAAVRGERNPAALLALALRNISAEPHKPDKAAG